MTTTCFNESREAFLKQLIQARGISGNCHEVATVLRQKLQGAQPVYDAHAQQLGLLHASHQADKAFNVMLNAHMDAVGMRVSYIDAAGFIYCRAVGGVDPLALKGQRVQIMTQQGSVEAIVQHTPIHHSRDGQDKSIPSLEQFYLRTGKTAHPIAVGDGVFFDMPYRRLGEELITAPGFDNRLGCMLISELFLELAKEKINYGLHLLFSSGEEIGCRGIRAATAKLNPDLAIVIDVTNASDYPGADKRKWGEQKTGGGPILAIGHNTNNRYNQALLDLAKAQKLPVQLRAEDITPTDGREIAEAGVPTLVVRLPGSMIHTANDTVAVADINSTFALLKAFLLSLPLKG